MKESSKIVFNHFYTLRHDIKRTHIIAAEEIKDSKKEKWVNVGWVSKIHPIYAMIFSILSSPITCGKAIKKIADFLDISLQEAETILNTFLNKQEPFTIEYKGVLNHFPKNIIISVNELIHPIQSYIPTQFLYKDVNLQQERFFSAPLGIVFMINNTCKTDCVYCYADRSKKRETISIKKIKEIIQNAFKLKVQNFGIVGGEFFLYKDWDKLLNILADYNYIPSLISTKIPLPESTIKKFQTYNIALQISLDSFNENNLTQILKVKKDYLSQIKESILLINKYNIPFQIATVITTYNESTQDLFNIYSFLQPLNNLKRWEIRIGFKSLYSRKDFDEIKVTKAKVKEIEQWVMTIQKERKINIQWSPETTNKYFKSENSKHFTGSRCSANYSHMVILPDGKVTICEQLYWNPRFIIGDLSTQTIGEVWSSKRALQLAHPSKEDFTDKSACKTCSDFEECYSYPNRCIADILKGYGDENWDYPDPRCKKAPQFINNLLHT